MCRRCYALSKGRRRRQSIDPLVVSLQKTSFRPNNSFRSRFIPTHQKLRKSVEKLAGTTYEVRTIHSNTRIQHSTIAPLLGALSILSDVSDDVNDTVRTRNRRLSACSFFFKPKIHYVPMVFDWGEFSIVF